MMLSVIEVCEVEIARTSKANDRLVLAFGPLVVFWWGY